MRLDYDLIGATKAGVHEHPEQFIIEKLGLELIRSESHPLMDCWFFEVVDSDKELPSFIRERDFKFYDELDRLPVV